MPKLLALISLIVSLIIQVGCDRVQKIVTPKQEQKTLKIGFIVAGDRAPYLNGANSLWMKLTNVAESSAHLSNWLASLTLKHHCRFPSKLLKT